MDNDNNDNNNNRDRSVTHRCSICNCVSVADIETDLGDFKANMSFTPDPKDQSQYICIDCSEAIQDVLYEFELDDEWKELSK